MTVKKIMHLFYLFFVYATIGWIIEVVFHAVNVGQFVNRGFLAGAYCPIYGFGMLFVLWFLHPHMDSPWRLFLFSIIITTLIELVGGFLLEFFFHNRWWDYSDVPFNFKGYICVRFSLYWGFAALIAVKFVHPVVEKFYDVLPHFVMYPLLGVLFCVIIVDSIITNIGVLNMNHELAELHAISNKIESFSDNFGERIADQVFRSQEAKKVLNKKFNERMDAFSKKHSRFLKAFPQLESKEHKGFFKQAKEKLHGAETQKKQNENSENNGADEKQSR